MSRPLPSPDPDDEAAFVRDLAADDDVEAVIEAIDAALAARRPKLAARLVGLVPDDEDDPAVAAARRAASLFLLRAPTAQEESDELDLAWALMRRRARNRLRNRLLRTDTGRYDRDPRGRRR